MSEQPPSQHSDSFVHLHVHTEYSMLDGAAKNKPLIAEAERLGMPAIAMSDHGNMFGAYEFFHLAKDTAVRPIIGIEAYVAPSTRHSRKQEFWARGGKREIDADGEGGKDVSGGGRYTHMTMWAKNAGGLRNLFRLSSRASFEGYYMKPRMDREIIAEHAEGIIATTGCPSGEVQTRLRLGQFDEALAAAAAYQDIFGKENYFLELMDHGLDIERNVRHDLIKIARELRIPLLATNDSHYVTEADADTHDNLLCVGVGKNKDDPHRFKFNGSGYYLKSSQEMRELFRELPQACDNTLRVAEMVESYDEVFAQVDRMPQFPDVPEGQSQGEFLRERIAEGITERFGDHVPEGVHERIETEMAVIEPMGFSSYFLVVSDICKYARDNGIPVGPGRGSAAGSLVAYLTRIIELNPLEHGLLFERFLNPERISPPDVDLDFDDRKRDQMVRYVTEKYGAEYTAQVNTFGTIKAKAAVKDASRILGKPFSVGDRISKTMPGDVMGKGVPLKELFNAEHPRYGEGADIRALYDADPEVKQVIDTGLGLEGLIRGTGVHAAAVILSSTPLLDLIPMHRRDKDGTIITGFSYPQCEEMGLVKMDFLGLRNLGIIDHAIKLIESNRGEHVSTETIPLDDPATYELLGRGDTLGVFQLDGGAMRNLLRLMKPTGFEDITAVLALYRPGPMGANAHINYAERKNGRQAITPIHPELKDALDPILGETYHLLVYQEQIMAIARELAGYTLGGADLLRRAMGKKKAEILEKEFANFEAGMTKNGYSAGAIKALWDVMLPFAGYAFNKSHAAGYGLVSAWTAYLKANYPAEYTAALLTSVQDTKDKMGIYLADARKLGIKVLPPDVNESLADFAAVGTDIRFGMAAVRNVGGNVVEGVIAAREEKGRFSSFEDFLRKVPAVVCNKRTIESLVKAGAFDDLQHPRQGLVHIHEPYVDSMVEEKKFEAVGQDSLFGGFGGDEPGIQLAALPPIPAIEWDKQTKLAFEREMLGLYVSDHPLFGIEHVLAQHADTSIARLSGDEGPPDGTTVTIAGLITGLQIKRTKKGDLWAIANVEDLDGSVECLFFPSTYMTVSTMLSQDVICVVKGRVNRRDEQVAINAMELTLPELKEGPRGPVLLTMPLARATNGVAERLKVVLGEHPGVTEVHLKLTQPGRSVTVKLDDAHRVTATPALFGDLKALLGPACLS
ncbi:DNA polymerase III subunit alpha [Luteipulveratus sp. YIM 133132]|uniref:DNA polymerase III subunit alpha n=1 Tax=Luteipulveratus flavus TaxID=3031728 RepID=A0ABT6C5Y5_9MICO|nr:MULTISPECIES: DNA polymerase III subunit alpha [unclassified Luteipulveratus]MDE9366471.1 DNA polymerase III subunit alpha [Luteipulveratus sp. YIM 133132]MDF8264255.1 DNA polymerase III subunit alpha [Luteipulveratus sp. YIM 133296]